MTTPHILHSESFRSSFEGQLFEVGKNLGAGQPFSARHSDWPRGMYLHLALILMPYRCMGSASSQLARPLRAAPSSAFRCTNHTGTGLHFGDRCLALPVTVWNCGSHFPSSMGNEMRKVCANFRSRGPPLGPCLGPCKYVQTFAWQLASQLSQPGDLSVQTFATP